MTYLTDDQVAKIERIWEGRDHGEVFVFELCEAARDRNRLETVKSELVEALAWFVDRRAAIQAKLDLYGPQDLAVVAKANFRSAIAALRNAESGTIHDHQA